MTLRFNPPPYWPQPPKGWIPPPGWQPPWWLPPPPPGWPLWIDDRSMDPGRALARMMVGPEYNSPARKLLRSGIITLSTFALVAAAITGGSGGFLAGDDSLSRTAPVSETSPTVTEPEPTPTPAPPPPTTTVTETVTTVTTVTAPPSPPAPSFSLPAIPSAIPSPSQSPAAAPPSPTPTATPSASPSPTGSPSASPSPTASPTNTAASDPRFDSCKEANDAGYGPYIKDLDPEFAWYPDEDGDGIACLPAL
ncbi:excalibur calcium-binding domain-containing protein [Rhizohabitans arisaemae]|uniref:excalibur calcium-binding domain-containing protein n=1 Tax=Rhizohabitans arisaemae TaxID=2720610 RepID=UPI0024B27B74|nr:excalibur calcium-binding domain-containing protein [Rhizohabitans arisaemae]